MSERERKREEPEGERLIRTAQQYTHSLESEYL